MAHLNPTHKELIGKVPDLRRIFKQNYAKNISEGRYDQRDLQQIEQDDVFACCFLRTLNARGDPVKAADGLHQSLEFRKSINLLDLTEADFPEEMTSRRAMYYRGQDKDGNPILYINVKSNTASGSEQVAMLKRYIAFYFNLHYRLNAGQMCVVLMDMSGAATSNISIDITKYIITCFTTFFPAFLAYMINYEMPFLLNATWKVISAFLSSEQKQKIRMVKKKEIGNYICDEYLWEHMK